MQAQICKQKLLTQPIVMSGVTHPPLSCPRWEKSDGAFLGPTLSSPSSFSACSYVLGKKWFMCPSLRLVLGSLLSSATVKQCDYSPSKVFWWSPLKSNLGGRPKASLENLSPTWRWEWLLNDETSSCCAAPVEGSGLSNWGVSALL